jgi:hypothetical protein
VTNAAYAKTALGLRDWAGDKCIGELALPGATVTTGLPAMTPADALGLGTRSLVIGIANEGGRIPPRGFRRWSRRSRRGSISSAGCTCAGECPAVRDAAERCGRALIDIRTPPPGIPVGSGASAAASGC